MSESQGSACLCLPSTEITSTHQPLCPAVYMGAGAQHRFILRPYMRRFFRGLTFLSGLTEEVCSDLFLVIRRNLTVRERKQVWGLCMIILPCFSIFLPYQCQLGKLRHRAANREAKVWVLEV